MRIESFELHAYSGREAGLMIIGDSKALSSLGKRLQRASEVPDEPLGDYPPLVAVISAESPYSDRPDFEVTFHVQRAPLPNELRRRMRLGASGTVTLVVGALALYGAITAVKGLLGVV